MTIPNLITIGRLCLVPLIVWLILAPEPVAAFAVFVVAGASDAVDGFLARQLNVRSDLGAYLDPLADKALLVSIYVAMAALNEIPLWLTILVVSRDVLIVGGVLLARVLSTPIAMKPSNVSKANTLAQITLAAVALGDVAFGQHLVIIREWLAFVVATLTIASAGLYVGEWVRHMGGISSKPTARS